MGSITLFLFTFIFTFVLWYALLPGLIMGIAIGMLVRNNSKSWKWCLVISGIAATMFIVVAADNWFANHPDLDSAAALDFPWQVARSRAAARHA